MSVAGESADQVVRMSLEGMETAIKVSGAAAERIIALLYTILSQEKKTKGKARLSSMLRSGKELKVFTLPTKDLQAFCKQAKHYGVMYCVLRDKNQDGNVDLMVRAEDAAKINRICERFKLASVDAASVKAEIQRSRENAGQELDAPEQEKSVEELLDALMPQEEPPAPERDPENPMISPTPEPAQTPEKSHPFEITLSPKEETARPASETDRERPQGRRRSVKKELAEIRAQQAVRAGRTPDPKTVHHAPQMNAGKVIHRKTKEVAR